MQGLADGYFVLPQTIGEYISGITKDNVTTSHDAFKSAATEAKEFASKLLSIKGKRTVDDFHRELGLIMWDHCGMARNNEGLKKAKTLIQNLRVSSPNLWLSMH